MRRLRLHKILIFLGASFLVIGSVFPFLQILSISLKTPLEWGRPNLIPKVVDISAYRELITGGKAVDINELPESTQRILNNPKLTDKQRSTLLKKYQKGKSYPFLKFMFNSFFLAVVSSLVSLAVSLFGAYAIARLRFRGQKIMQRGVLFVYLIGGIVIMVPLYQLATGLNLTSNSVGIIFTLVIVYVLQTLPLALYMIGNYLRGIPDSLEEAAKIDGCSNMGIIQKIIVPLSKPILATVFIYCFIIAWNEYLYASVFLRGQNDLYTIPVAIRSLFVSKNAIWARIMAASMLTLTPIFLFFGVLSKNLQKGLVEGGVKE